jgi:hypothetical protein
MTVAESMALAVLKGDMVAAYALADALIEERDEGRTKFAKAAAALREKKTRYANDGYGVYRWPEFRAFCDRAGIPYGLGTRSISFSIEEGEALEVRHTYIAFDAETAQEGP